MMPQLVIFPDVEDLVRGYLASQLAQIEPDALVVAGSLPKDLPAKSVRVRRTGGPSDSVVLDRAQITVECRATIERKAAALAANVRAVVNALGRDPTAVNVGRVAEFSGPYLDPDPVNPKQSRYTATYQVTVRGTVQ